jgi:hypothetical protein
MFNYDESEKVAVAEATEFEREEEAIDVVPFRITCEGEKVERRAWRLTCV